MLNYHMYHKNINLIEWESKMNFKFYQLFRSMKEELGLERAKELFPEYETLPDKMSKEEQVNLARILMKRLDDELDKDKVISIRMKHPCGVPKPTQQRKGEIKEEFINDDERIHAFIKHLNGTYERISDNEYLVTWGLTECVCGMFRNLKEYEPISPTWCPCCNGHNELLFTALLDKEVKSELLSGICAGHKECSFRVIIS